MTKARNIADSELGSLTVDTDTLYVDSANNRVGIGTSSPSAAVDIEGNNNAGAAQNVLRFTDFDESASPEQPAGRVEFYSSDNNSPGVVSYIETVVGTGADGRLTFGTGFGGSASEAMRIDSSGNLLVGTTVPNGSLHVASGGAAYTGYFTGTSSGQNIACRSAVTSGTAIIFLSSTGTDVGSIDTTGTTTSYNTSSDERLKENIADAQPASDLVDGIQVREFDWKADGEHQRYGMIAQELDTVAPEAVTKGETEDDMWSVDYSKLVPMLVKEIQDLRKRVAALENAQ